MKSTEARELFVSDGFNDIYIETYVNGSDVYHFNVPTREFLLMLEHNEEIDAFIDEDNDLILRGRWKS